MKLLIPILIGLLVVGCGNNSPSSNPAKELTIKDVVGSCYELKDNEEMKMQFLGDGKLVHEQEHRVRQFFHKWKIEGNEIHTTRTGWDKNAKIFVHIINPNGYLYNIAYIKDGRRTDYAKDNQPMWRKTK